MKKTSRQRTGSIWAFVLACVVMLAACSGQDDTPEPAAELQETPRAIEPGSRLTMAGLGRVVVGQTYTQPLAALPLDDRNAITGYTVTNPTPGGAAPAVAADGTMSWTPNATDLDTTQLRVTVHTQTGDPVVHLLPVTTWVSQLELSALIQAGERFYSDPQGAYVVEVAIKDGETAPGTLRVYSYRSRAGAVTHEIQADPAKVFAVLREHPQLPVANAAALSTQGNTLNKATPNSESGMQLTPDENSAYGGLVTQGITLYNPNHPISSLFYVLRSNIKAVNIEGAKLVVQPAKNLIQVDRSCSLQPGDTALALCAGTRSPVILIHGFTLDAVGLGGGNGTWGALPQVLRDNQHDVFEFRWFTHMRFEEAAGQFTKLINAVARSTGRKPIILAHSFGGIVSHLALSGQGIEWKGQQWSPVALGRAGQSPTDVVAKLITLGSPVGGIYDGTGVTLPGMEWGRDNELTINVCQGITCIQAGASDVGRRSGESATDILNSMRLGLAYATLETPPSNTLRFEDGTRYERFLSSGQVLNFAETIARLGKITTGIAAVDATVPVKHSVDTLAVVGVIGKAFVDSFPLDHRLGDGLISVKGQVFPEDLDSLPNPILASDLTRLEAADTFTRRKVYRNSNIKYLFVADIAHTTFQEAVARTLENPHVAFAEASVGEDFLYAPIPIRVASVRFPEKVMVTHPLRRITTQEMAFTPQLYDAPVVPPWWARGSVVDAFLSPASLTTQAGENFPFSIEVRDRSSGSRVLRSYAYGQTEADGSYRIDLNALIGDIPVAQRTNLYAYLTFGDNFTYDVQRVTVNSLGADEVVVPAVTLTRIADRAGAVDVSGRVIDGQTLGTGIADATIRLRQGKNLPALDLDYTTNTLTSRLVHTDANGNFFVSQLRPGTYSALVQKAGYVDEVQGQITVAANGRITLSLLKILTDVEASVTLRWDTATSGGAVSSDLDSHLLRLRADGSTDYHISYRVRTGLDGDNLDRDDTDYEGPETVTFNPLADRNYIYYVHNYTGEGTIPSSNPLVIVRIGAAVYRFDLPVSASNNAGYWRVFDLVGGQVQPCVSGCLTQAPPTTMGAASAVSGQSTALVLPQAGKGTKGAKGENN